MTIILVGLMLITGVAFALGFLAGRLDRRINRGASRVETNATRGSPSTLRKREPSIGSRRTAVHEAGHAVAAWYCTAVARIKSVTLEEVTFNGCVKEVARVFTRNDAWCDLVRTLAGCMAEVVVLKGFRSGPAASDLSKARAIVERHGLHGTEPPWKDTENPAFVFPPCWDPPLEHGEREVIDRASSFARALIEVYEPEILRVADLLEEKKELDEADLERVLGTRVFVRVFSIAKTGFFIPDAGRKKRAS